MTSTTPTTPVSNSLNKRKFVAPAAATSLWDDSSDTSGRFDDADESDDMQLAAPVAAVAAVEEKVEDTTSVHSAKRGRSNGWPLQSEIAYDENGMKIDLSERRNTPTPGKSKNRASPVLRIRRSRFIEGSMNDRVSEKPPSIYFQESRPQGSEETSQSYPQQVDAQTETNKKLEKRSSGIFRFGKAIASAFHPFVGSKSISKSEQDSSAKSQKEIMKQRQLKAEKAYAELKKAGYKGTIVNPNVHFKNQVDAGIADETWKSIQEKMGYKLPDENRISQDDTLVGVVPGDGLGPMSTERSVSKLKSFSELRKRTSNLSIPAVRYRDVSPMSMRGSMERDIDDNNLHPPMERRQSRKELNKQAKLLKRVSNLEDKLERARRELRECVPNEIQHPPIPAICVDDEHDRQSGPGNLPTLLSERLLEAGHVQRGVQGTSQRTVKWPPADSLSRKRKSPVPMPIDTVHDTDDQKEEYDADCGKPANDEGDEGKPRQRNKLKSVRDKRTSSLTTKASQRLKAKQSSRNLRAAASTTTPTTEDGRCLQEQEGNTSTTTPTPSARKSRGWTPYSSDYENIPPVPPVPKELLTGKSSKEKSVLSTMKARIPSKEFSWPEDIF